jgi:hypothetical protein
MDDLLLGHFQSVLCFKVGVAQGSKLPLQDETFLFLLSPRYLAPNQSIG